MRKTVFYLIITLIFAWSISYFGGMSRPYDAFGGEDMLALTIAVYGIYRAVASRKEARDGKRA